MTNKKTLHETNRYPESFFPFEIYQVEKYRMTPAGRGFDNLHWHEEVQFTLAEVGDLVLQINGQEVVLHEGEGIFINSGILHTTKDMAEDGHYISINFENRLLSFFLGSLMEQRYVRPYLNDYWLPSVVLRLDSTWQQEAVNKLKTIKTTYLAKKQPAWEYQLVIWLTEVWYLIITHVTIDNEVDTRLLQQKQSRIQQLLSFVQQNYDQALTLAELATSAHISIAECTRCFKEFTGSSPYDYVIQYRITKAADLLQTTTASIDQIAVKVGFNATSNFIQTFKQRIGVTPLHYRKLRYP